MQFLMLVASDNKINDSQSFSAIEQRNRGKQTTRR